MKFSFSFWKEKDLTKKIQRGVGEWFKNLLSGLPEDFMEIEIQDKPFQRSFLIFKPK